MNFKSINPGDKIEIKYAGQTEPYYYIRLGAFLEFIQDNIIYLAKNDSGQTPILKFDTDVETNLMYLEDLQISVDPRICVVNRNLTINNLSYSFSPGDYFESTLFPGKRCFGKIMNIYVHMKWILLELDRLKDNINNKVVLIDFLNSLLSNISAALGGVNDLEAVIDETINTVIIIDKNPLPNRDDLVIPKLNEYLKGANKKQIPTGDLIFDLFGYQFKTDSKDKDKLLSTTSFIKDFNFTTEISPNLSTMLTVGATANSTVVGENSTAFSKFNTGLTDRFNKQIVQPNVKEEGTTDEDKELEALVNQYEQNYYSYVDYLKRLSVAFEFNNNKSANLVKYVEGEGDTYKNCLTSYTLYAQQIRRITEQNTEFSPSTGFIPFNMSLTMDGLSGMKIYNKFNIDTRYLPSNYPDYADFIIKSITHKIENSKWFTTIESIAISKGGGHKTKKNNLPYNKAEPKPKEGKKLPYPSPPSQYPNVKFQNIGLGNPSNDQINPNLLQDISKAAENVGVVVSITTAVSGHNTTPPTRHSSGQAVDIAIIDGIAVRPNANNRSKIDAFVNALIGLGYVKNAERGNTKAVLTFGFPSHDDHIHVSNKT